MANNYSVDEILAEVRRKKEQSDEQLRRTEQRNLSTTQQRVTETTAPARSVEPRTATPFRMTGLTEEFDTPLHEKQLPLIKAERSVTRDEEYTRVDLPIGRANSKPDLGATRVMSAVKPPDDQFEERRREKVREFMQRPFSGMDEDDDEASMSMASEPQEEQDEDNEQLGHLAQFFGGLSHNEISTKQSRGEESGTNKSHKDASTRTGRQSRKQEQRADAGRHATREKENQEEGEYCSPSDRAQVVGDIAAIRRGLMTRMVVTGICFVLLLYLALCNLYPIPLLQAIQPEVNMQLFVLSNLVVLILAALCSNAVIGSGILSLFTLRADHDTPAALCTLAVVAHGVACVVTPEFLHTGEGCFYFSAAALGLLFNALGKYMMILRISQNFAVASADTVRTGEYLLEPGALAQELCQGQNLDEPTIAYPVEVAFPEEFLRLSYADDYAESMSRSLSPIFLLFAIAVALVARLAFGQSTMQTLTIFTALTCMASPLTPTLIGNLPLLRAARQLSKEGAFISGYESIEQFENMNAVALSADELYPAGNVMLHGIKAFAESRIDEAILDAASVMCSVDGLLKDVFLGIISRKTTILKQVESLVYLDGMGISAQVNGKTVLIGNRELMRHCNVDAPSRDYEKKFIKSDRQILYLANSGEVTAMFVLSYQTSRDAARWLDVLAHRSMSLIVHSTDPNITAARIASDYHYPEDYVRIIPAAIQSQYRDLAAPRARGAAFAMSLGSTSVRLRVLAALHTIKSAVLTGSMIQLVGLVLGYALVTFLAFTGAIGQLGFLPLILFQLLWTLLVVLVPSLFRV